MEKICIIGMGYVGLPLSLVFAEAGLKVVGLDIDENKVKSLNGKKSYIRHIPSEKIKTAIEQYGFKASSDFSEISSSDAVIICVPTPLNRHREPDLKYILDSGEKIAPHMKKGITVVLESTTYPGTTENELRTVLEKGSKLVAGKDFYLAFSPEREDPGNPDSKVKIIPKIIGGYNPSSLKKAMELYGKAIKTLVPVSSCATAEAAKLTENIFRSVNIALVNELKMIYGKMGIDIFEVIEAAKTKPFGFMPFYPGPGLGGHCIPIDPFYLTWKAREFEEHTKFIELAGEINTYMPNYVIGIVEKALNDSAKSVRNSKILLLGMAYKSDVDDDRESPSYILLKKLEELGAIVSYNDPYVPSIGAKREFPQYRGKNSVPVSDDFDLILIATAHTEYKGMDFSNYNSIIVDSRNCVAPKNRPSKYFRA